MKHEFRELVVMCESVSGVWVPEKMWVEGNEVVRCRNCKYFQVDKDPIDPGWPWVCEDCGRDMLNPDGFCAWGEKRDD